MFSGWSRTRNKWEAVAYIPCTRKSGRRRSQVGGDVFRGQSIPRDIKTG